MSKETATEEAAFFNLMKAELYSPVLGDVLDRLGYIHQILPQPIQPLATDMVIVGRAMPVLMTDIYEEPEKPFGYVTEALDQLQPGEVYMAAGGSMRCACWGEILTVTARMRGAVGAIVNGFHHDTPKVLAQDWPVFSRGRYAQDLRVRMQAIDYRCPIEMDGISIKPGDLIFADLDGVIVIPAEVEKEVIEQSLEKVRKENLVRKEIENGMSSTEAYRKYGVL
jgi:4-hydroxy-4-methyl-2-oxoglutarate aldolase